MPIALLQCSIAACPLELAAELPYCNLQNIKLIILGRLPVYTTKVHYQNSGPVLTTNVA